MKKTILILMLASLSIGAQAAGCVTKPRNAFDQVYCAGNLFAQVDRDLNQAYSGLRKHLTGAQQNLLKQGQLAWIAQRDAECSEEKANGYFINLDCAVNLTQSRLDFLKERERECLSTGCNSEKLAK